MSLGNVLDAVKARWTDQALGATITGGIRLIRGKGLVAPYVIASMIASPIIGRASRGEGTGTDYETTQIQLLYVGKAGPAAARTQVATLKAAFDWAPLSLDSDTLIFCKFVSEIILDDPEDPGNPNAVLWALTYDVQTAEATTLSPS